MACPDKNKDKIIIQEIERRKTLQLLMPETYQEIYMDIDLFSLAQFLDTEKLISIHKTEEGWTVTKYM